MSLDGLTVKSVPECVSAEVAAALKASFEGYLIPMEVDAEGYERRFRADDLDPFASRVYFRGERPAGILLIGRRGRTGRIAAMGVAAGERRKGIGKEILRGAIRDAEKREDRTVVLEVFEQNESAVGLYEGLGFHARRRLFGYHLESDADVPETSDEPSELDPLELARVVACEGEPNPPWMLSAESLSAATLPARAYHLNHRAYALIGDPDAGTLALNALVVRKADRRKGWGTRMLNALRAAFPARAWTVPQILPGDFTRGFFTSRGWRRSRLNQIEMYLDLKERS